MSRSQRAAAECRCVDGGCVGRSNRREDASLGVHAGCTQGRSVDGQRTNASPGHVREPRTSNDSFYSTTMGGVASSGVQVLFGQKSLKVSKIGVLTQNPTGFLRYVLDLQFPGGGDTTGSPCCSHSRSGLLSRETLKQLGAFWEVFPPTWLGRLHPASFGSCSNHIAWRMPVRPLQGACASGAGASRWSTGLKRSGSRGRSSFWMTQTRPMGLP